MKINEKLAKNDVKKIKDEENEEEDVEFSVDKEDEWIIFKSFTNYSNPQASIVREITSNAFDAHIEAGVKKSVDIEITEENTFTGASSTISFRDYGEGMSPDIIRNIYSKFGKSTKRHTNDLIGAKGFGAKAPLGYQDMFTLITINDGVKYHYAIHSGEKRPVISLMSKEETDQPSGSKVIINIKEGEVYKFQEALKQQLKYFDNINYTNCGISNDYQIIRGKHFVYRMIESKDSYYDRSPLHLCLGKVYYPVDENLVGRHRINIGLRFEIGDIPVVWNRENVEYKGDTTEKIKKKVKLAREELQGLYDQRYKDINDLSDFIKFDDSSNMVPLIEEDGEEKGIKCRSNFIDTNITYPKYEYLRVKSNRKLYGAFSVAGSITKGYGVTSFYNVNPETDNIILAEKGEVISKMKKKYVLEEMDGDWVILRKNNKKHSIKRYLRNYFPGGDIVREPFEIEKEERQGAIREVNELYDEVTQFIRNNSITPDDIEVTEEFEEAYKAAKAAERKRKKEIFHYLSVRVTGSFSRTRINGERLKSEFGNEPVIYGFQEDRELLREVQKIISNELGFKAEQRVNVVQISMRNERVVKEVLPDTAFHAKEIEKIPFFRRLSCKYDQMAFRKEVSEKLDISLATKRIPSYITPEEPKELEKLQVLKEVGQKIKYPLLKYIMGSAPDEEIQRYKESCPNHHVNPILITKKRLKDYEESQRTDKQQ